MLIFIDWGEVKSYYKSERVLCDEHHLSFSFRRENNSAKWKSINMTGRGKGGKGGAKLFVVWLAVVVSSVSLVWSTKKPVVSWKFSWKTSSVMPSHTLNTPRERRSPGHALCTVSEVKLFNQHDNINDSTSETVFLKTTKRFYEKKF